MSVLVTNSVGHLQHQLTRSFERLLEEANQSGELKLSNRKLKEFPKECSKYNLSDTVIADLSKNRFNELPEEVTGFPFLERLQCHHNAIRHIPDTVGSLQCLNYVDISRNQLTALPKEICNLPIQVLLVSNNRLGYLPDELGQMSQLTELDVSGNQLTHLPPRMGDLHFLRSLILRSNHLLCVTVEVTYLNLTKLDLRANRICTLPVELINMESLIELFVEDNPLTSPPASLCRRGRVHIFKYLETEALKIERKTGIGSSNTLGRKSRRTSANTGLPIHLPDRLRPKRHNVDSGYSTSDGFDKRWSQEIIGDVEKHWTSSPTLTSTSELNGTNSATSTPSTISPDVTLEDRNSLNNDFDRRDKPKAAEQLNSARSVLCAESAIVNGNPDARPYQPIQTYREYKEALKQQRAQDVPSVYRTRDNEDQYRTEPNTPTHNMSPTRNSLATSKSDPTPLNAALCSPKHIYDDTASRKPIQKVTPSRNMSVDHSKEYVKPKSPLRISTGILSHNNVPPMIENYNTSMSNGKPTSPRIAHTINYFNGAIKNANRSISWTPEPEKVLNFTMRREFDKAKEESEMIQQLRHIIETRLKMALPKDVSSALIDGVVLCHLANQIKPRSVASIHVPSPAVPKLTMARCRRNVDNFIEACRKIGVDENLICCSADVLEGRGLVQVAITVVELLRFHTKSPIPFSVVNSV